MAASNGTSATERHAIGISFGNSNSSIALAQIEGKPEVVANEDGDRQIPTVLSYIEGEEFTGNQAKSQLVRNHKNTVAYFRDFIGQDFKSIDPTHCHFSAHPESNGQDIVFKIQDKTDGEPSTLSISEVTTRHLRRLAQSAEDFSGKKVTAAVITIPSNFTDAQKDALIKSAKQADIEVLQLISEPVAALLAYDAKSEEGVKDKIVVVADLGGTRSDVAVIAARGGMYTTLATAHDYEFAGVHLDQVIMDHFSKEFIKWNTTDPRLEQRSYAKLKAESEAVKKSLSIGTNGAFAVESLAEGQDFNSTITRSRYETIARKVFDGFNRLIEGVVKKANLDVLDIDEVILSGGTSHTPRIASNMRTIFPETTVVHAPSTSPTAINPSELQARGAALQASLIQEYESEDIEQSTHAAVTTVKHLSNAIGLSVGSDSNQFLPIITAETALPARRSIQVNAPADGGDVLVKIVEGESYIKVTKPEPRAKTDKVVDEDDSDFDDSDDEDEETREKAWKVGKSLAEIAIRGVKKGGKVEVVLNVKADLSVDVTAREVGAKGGVRGLIQAS